MASHQFCCHRWLSFRHHTCGLHNEILPIEIETRMNGMVKEHNEVFNSFKNIPIVSFLGTNNPKHNQKIIIIENISSRHKNSEKISSSVTFVPSGKDGKSDLEAWRTRFLIPHDGSSPKTIFAMTNWFPNSEKLQINPNHL